jgi:hypothetical protein
MVTKSSATPAVSHGDSIRFHGKRNYSEQVGCREGHIPARLCRCRIAVSRQPRRAAAAAANPSICSTKNSREMGRKRLTLTSCQGRAHEESAKRSSRLADSSRSVRPRSSLSLTADWISASSCSLSPNSSSVPLANARARSVLRKFARRSFVRFVAMLAVRVPGKRVAPIQSASNLLKYFSHVATAAHMSIVRHNLLQGCDVFYLPKLSASIAVLCSDIVINHVWHGKKVPGGAGGGGTHVCLRLARRRHAKSPCCEQPISRKRTHMACG